MDAKLSPLVNLLRLHTDLVRNALSGVSDEHALSRPLGGSNSMSFIAAHLVDARYYLASTLGNKKKSPLSDVLGSAKSIEDVDEFPAIDQIRELWLASEPHVLDAFGSATAEMLATPSNIGFPTDDRTTFGTVAFLVHHEAYHLGQLGLLRKGLGYGSMSYERR